MRVTEAQGAEFLNGLQTLVVMMAIVLPCSVALVVAGVFAFFRRG
jgi:hypothetical protein